MEAHEYDGVFSVPDVSRPDGLRGQHAVLDLVDRVYSSNQFPFLTEDFWKEHFEWLQKVPDDPETLYELAAALWHYGSGNGKEYARELVFEDENPSKPRWPDDEMMCVLAAEMFMEEAKFADVLLVLRNKENQPRWPGNQDALRLLTKAFVFLGMSFGGELADISGDRMFKDFAVLKNCVNLFLRDRLDEQLLALLSPVNPHFVDNFSHQMVLIVLKLLQKAHRFDLLLKVSENCLAFSPSLEENAFFCAYASRAMKYSGKLGDALKLLALEGKTYMPRFPEHPGCVKNLAYVLLASGRAHEGLLAIRISRDLGRVPKKAYHNVLRALKNDPSYSGGT